MTKQRSAIKAICDLPLVYDAGEFVKCANKNGWQLTAEPIMQPFPGAVRVTLVQDFEVEHFTNNAA